MLGDVPEEMGRDFRKMLGAPPLKIDAHVERIPTGFEISAVSVMANAEDAQNAIMHIGKLRKEGIDQLQKLLQQPDAAPPGLPVNGLINVLNTLQMQSEGMEVRLRVVVPRDVVMALPSVLLGR